MLLTHTRLCTFMKSQTVSVEKVCNLWLIVWFYALKPTQMSMDVLHQHYCFPHKSSHKSFENNLPGANIRQTNQIKLKKCKKVLSLFGVCIGM